MDDVFKVEKEKKTTAHSQPYESVIRKHKSTNQEAVLHQPHISCYIIYCVLYIYKIYTCISNYEIYKSIIYERTHFCQ